MNLCFCAKRAEFRDDKKSEQTSFLDQPVIARVDFLGGLRNANESSPWSVYCKPLESVLVSTTCRSDTLRDSHFFGGGLGLPDLSGGRGGSGGGSAKEGVVGRPPSTTT